jgi:hypothetical protein
MSATTSRHGTRSRYNKRGCRCRLCREANTTYHTELCDRLATLPEAQVPHGLNGYRNYSCRCAVCREAQRIEMRRYKLSRRVKLAGAR